MDGCPNQTVARGWCSTHYQRWHKHGDPLKVMPNLGNRTPRVIPAVRTCRFCGFVGDKSLFRVNSNRCKPCGNAYKKQWKESNPEKVQASLKRNAEAIRRRELRRRAVRNGGLDPDMVERYYNKHDGTCEICGRKPEDGERDLHIDHDHATGAFRGLLCSGCNNGLGRFKDSVETLHAAIRYLQRADRQRPHIMGGGRIDAA